MPANKPPCDDLLNHAAELRAGGLSWEAVAAQVGRSAETVRKWPAAYPDRWQALLHAAERRLARDAGAESVLILRQLLRSDDEKIRRDAARLLINLRLQLARLDHTSAAQAAARPTSGAVRLLAHLLETHSDEQLTRLVTPEFERVAGPHPVPARRVDGGPP
jgi:hypothetical protein